MQRIILSKKNLNELLSRKSLSSDGNVFNVDGKLYKISKGYFFDIEHFNKLLYKPNEVDVNQIEWLSSMQSIASKSSLPEGIIQYKNLPIGVIYPHCFENYQNFNYLHQEDTSLVFDNIRKSVINNINLFEADIYNTDLLNQNVLYKREDVQLIDLDGKYIKRSNDCTINDVYSYFLSDVFKIIVRKLKQQYPMVDVKRIGEEVRNLFVLKYNCIVPIDYPIQVLDKIEKMKILK